MTWQNQYNLTHLTVSELMGALLPDLEAIKWVMVEKQNKKLKAKGKAATAQPEAKSNPKRKASGGPTGPFPKEGCSEKFCQHCKAQIGPTRPTTPWTANLSWKCRHFGCLQKVNFEDMSSCRPDMSARHG
jgi:hypothetical protein